MGPLGRAIAAECAARVINVWRAARGGGGGGGGVCCCESFATNETKSAENGGIPQRRLIDSYIFLHTLKGTQARKMRRTKGLPPRQKLPYFICHITVLYTACVCVWKNKLFKVEG